MTFPHPGHALPADPKPKPPRWYRLPSTLWLGAAIILCALLTIDLVRTNGDYFFVLALLALVSGVGVFVASLLEMIKYRRPVGSIVNLCTEAVTNPLVVLVVFVNIGILDFG